MDFIKTELEGEHKIECKLTPATRPPSTEICFCTLWPCDLDLWPNVKWVAMTHDGQVGKFGDCSFSRFGSIMRTHTDANERYTPAVTLVGVSNNRQTY